MKLNYAIKFVADMDKAVAFHRDTRSMASVSAALRIEHTRRFTSARVFRLEAGAAAATPHGSTPITLTNAFTIDLPARSVTTLELIP